MTDPAARRYFLTLDEAVNAADLRRRILCHRRCLAPDLPATHSIAELARFMARELAPDERLPSSSSACAPATRRPKRCGPTEEPTQPGSLDGMVVVETALPTKRNWSRTRNLRAALECPRPSRRAHPSARAGSRLHAKPGRAGARAAVRRLRSLLMSEAAEAAHRRRHHLARRLQPSLLAAARARRAPRCRTGRLHAGRASLARVRLDHQ